MNADSVTPIRDAAEALFDAALAAIPEDRWEQRREPAARRNQCCVALAYLGGHLESARFSPPGKTGPLFQDRLSDAAQCAALLAKVLAGLAAQPALALAPHSPAPPAPRADRAPKRAGGRAGASGRHPSAQAKPAPQGGKE